MAITVTNLLTNAVAEMGGDITSLTDYEAYALASVNKMYADLFEINNDRLVQADGTALTAIPTVTAVANTITYQEELIRNVMVYGLARDLSRKDNNPSINAFTRMYDENKERYNIGTATEITDYYADNTDA